MKVKDVIDKKENKYDEISGWTVWPDDLLTKIKKYCDANLSWSIWKAPVGFDTCQKIKEIQKGIKEIRYKPEGDMGNKSYNDMVGYAAVNNDKGEYCDEDVSSYSSTVDYEPTKKTMPNTLNSGSLDQEDSEIMRCCYDSMKELHVKIKSLKSLVVVQLVLTCLLIILGLTRD